MSNSIRIAIEKAFIDLWGDVISIIPELVAALLVFIVGLVIASVGGKLTRKVVHFLQVDTLAERMHVHETLGKIGLTFTFSDVLGQIVKWFFVIVFLNASVEILGWTQITTFLNDVLLYIPQVLVAVVMLAIGLIAASFIEEAVTKALSTAQSSVRSPKTLGTVAKWAVVGFTFMAALIQLRVAEELISILFAAIVFALALAFGLGGKDHAAHFLDKLFK